MKRIRIIGLALVAVFALSAVAASSAMAVKPEFVGAGANEKVKFTSGPGELETVGGRKIKCTSDSGEGTIVNEFLIDKIKLSFSGCKAKVPLLGEVNCQTAGQATGLIDTELLHALLVYSPGASTVLVLILPETGTTYAKFICGSGSTETELTVKGEALGLIGTVGSPTKLNIISATLSKGKPTDLEYELEKGSGIKKVQMTTEGKKIGFLGETFAAEEGGLSGQEDALTEKAVEIKG